MADTKREIPFISVEWDGVHLFDDKGEHIYTHEEAKEAIRVHTEKGVPYFLCSSSVDFPEETGHPNNIRELLGLEENRELSNVSHAARES